MKQSIAFQLASTPRAAAPGEHSVPAASAAVAVPAVAALPVVFCVQLEVVHTVDGKLVKLAALNVGAVWNEGCPAPPEAGPANTEFCAAFDCVKVRAGVLVGVATEVVNSGESAPAENVVTVPVPVPEQVMVYVTPATETLQPVKFSATKPALVPIVVPEDWI
jgi:hypothetical protein